MVGSLVCACEEEPQNISQAQKAECPSSTPYANQCAYIEQVTTVAQFEALGITQESVLLVFAWAFGAYTLAFWSGFLVGIWKKLMSKF